MKYFFENCNAVASIAMIFIATILLANGLELFAVWFLVMAVLIRTFTLEEVIKSLDIPCMYILKSYDIIP